MTCQKYSLKTPCGVTTQPKTHEKTCYMGYKFVKQSYVMLSSS